MSQDHIRMLIECINAALQEVTAIEIVCRRPFKKLPTRLLNHEIVIRRKAYVARLTDVTDSGILARITIADVGCAVGRCVIRYDQLEILVALAEQGFYRLREVFLAVVDGKPDAEPGCTVHGA